MSKLHQPTPVGNAIVTTQGRGRNARQIVRIGEWEASVWGSLPDHEPRIRDLELAERLGFSQARDIRTLIKRNFEASRRPLMRGTVQRMKNRSGYRAVQVDEYWLTEEEALFIASRSRTAKATALTRAVIAFFVQARRGLLELPKPTPAPDRLSMLMEQTGQLTAAVTALVSTVQALVVRQMPAEAPAEPPQLPPTPLALPSAAPAPRGLRGSMVPAVAVRQGLACMHPTGGGSEWCGYLHTDSTGAWLCRLDAKLRGVQAGWVVGDGIEYLDQHGNVLCRQLIVENVEMLRRATLKAGQALQRSVPDMTDAQLAGHFRSITAIGRGLAETVVVEHSH